MSSTNKTANLQLSQFLGTDKPTWLGDYNADMQKIDDGYAALKTGEATSTAKIAALQQKDTQLDQDIKDINDRIDNIATGDIALGNRVTTLEGNYDTMHHEVANNQSKIVEMEPYAMIAADKKGSINFRSSDLVAFDNVTNTQGNTSILDIVKDSGGIRTGATSNTSGNDTFFCQFFDATNNMLRDTNITLLAGGSMHFELRNDEEVAIHFKYPDHDKFLSVDFSKTNGISFILNDHGNITQLFNIPIPTAPVTPTV